MLKLFRKRGKIEKDLNRTVKIFGETISVRVIYKKLKNPELDLVGNIINVYLPNKYKRSGNIEIVKLAEKVMEETRIMLKGLAPENYEIRKLSNKLSKLTLERVIIINPEIVKYNKQVLKYVILHEFCHLKYKTHSKGFYKMMQKYMPEYESYEYIEQVA